jgi:hypothetical protein
MSCGRKKPVPISRDHSSGDINTRTVPLKRIPKIRAGATMRK